MEEMIYGWWVFLYKKRYSRKGNHDYGIYTNNFYARDIKEAINMLVARLQKRNIPYNNESIIGVTKQTSENSKEFRKTLKEWLQK